MLYINSYNAKFIWETKRKWIVWIVRETLHVNEKKKKKLQSSTYRLHTFLRMIGIFYDKPRKQNQEKNKTELKKKLNHIDCKIAWVYDHLIPSFKIIFFYKELSIPLWFYYFSQISSIIARKKKNLFYNDGPKFCNLKQKI